LVRLLADEGQVAEALGVLDQFFRRPVRTLEDGPPGRLLRPLMEPEKRVQKIAHPRVADVRGPDALRPGTALLLESLAGSGPLLVDGRGGLRPRSLAGRSGRTEFLQPVPHAGGGPDIVLIIAADGVEDGRVAGLAPALVLDDAVAGVGHLPVAS